MTCIVTFDASIFEERLTLPQCFCDAHTKHNWVDPTHTHGYAKLHKVNQLALQSLKPWPWADLGITNNESRLFEDDPRQLPIYLRLKICMQCNTLMQAPINDSQLIGASQPQLVWPIIVRHCTDTIQLCITWVHRDSTSVGGAAQARNTQPTIAFSQFVGEGKLLPQWRKIVSFPRYGPEGKWAWNAINALQTRTHYRNTFPKYQECACNEYVL